MKLALKNKAFFIFAFFFLFCIIQARQAFSESCTCNGQCDCAGSGGSASVNGDYSIAGGDIMVTLHRKLGTFSFYKLSPAGDGTYEPLLDTRNYSAASRFAVYAGGKTHVLENKLFNKIDLEVSRGGREASFVFTPSKDLQVVQRFFIEENDSFGQRAHVLAIETTIENTSGREMPFYVRAVFDTMLGESRSALARGHFITGMGQAVNSETLLRLDDSSSTLLFSSNGEKSCAFLIPAASRGNSANNVYLANWSRCDSLLRGPANRSVSPVEGRSFNSTNAINDSAVLMNWPEVMLGDGEKASFVVYLSAVNPKPGLSPSAAMPSFESYNAESLVDGADEDDDEFRKKQELYFSVSGRLRQIESGEVEAEQEEVDDLNQILDFLLEDIR